MPTYQYHCPHCDTEFEEVQRMTDPALEHCPTCNKKPERLISKGGGLIFKGSGFYITDYKKSGKDEGAKSESAESSKSEAPKGDSPKSDAPKNDSPKSETPKADSSPKADSGGKAAPKD
ncbi:MAG: FmdB family zinc ribbon protein [Candidatus Zixiibacteriota bacterium]